MTEIPTVLFVCTGNICRSPMAEGMLRERAAARSVEVNVSSRGLSLRSEPATAEARRAASDRGADIGAHRSALLDAQVIEEADLVLGMERQHVREAVVLVPDALDRSFTLKDLVRRASATRPRGPEERFDRWVRRIGGGRRPGDLSGFGTDDEVADPYSRSRADYDRCADEIADLVDRLLALAWPGASREGAA